MKTMIYEKTNPIQTQFKPNLSQLKPIQTQFVEREKIDAESVFTKDYEENAAMSQKNKHNFENILMVLTII